MDMIRRHSLTLTIVKFGLVFMLGYVTSLIKDNITLPSSESLLRAAVPAEYMHHGPDSEMYVRFRKGDPAPEKKCQCEDRVQTLKFPSFPADDLLSSKNKLDLKIKENVRLESQPNPLTDGKKKPASGPSLACGVITSPENWLTRARAIEYTWAPRCDAHYYYYSNSTKFILEGAVPVNVKEGRDWLTGKSQAFFRHAYKAHGDKIDWYLKVDDDTFVIVENVKYILAFLDPSKPYYVGEMLVNSRIPGYRYYHSGGAGYVLSREAVRRLVEYGPLTGWCPKQGSYEDIDIGSCMKILNVTLVDALDVHNRRTFHSWNPIVWFNPSSLEHRLLNYRNVFRNDPRSKSEALSVGSATFHYVTPGQMYIFDYIIYDLCLYGRGDKCKGPRFPWEREHSVFNENPRPEPKKIQEKVTRQRHVSVPEKKTPLSKENTPTPSVKQNAAPKDPLRDKNARL